MSDTVVALREIREGIHAQVSLLTKAAHEAEGGNLAEVYGGARDWLLDAGNAVGMALETLAPEEGS